MIKRASEEEQVGDPSNIMTLVYAECLLRKAKKRREEAEAQEEAERERLFAEAFKEQLQADAQRHQMERERHRARHRARSDATEVPDLADDILTQSFDREINVNGLCFLTVKLFHPQHGKSSFDSVVCNLKTFQIALALSIKQNLSAMILPQRYRSRCISSHSTLTITPHTRAVRS